MAVRLGLGDGAGMLTARLARRGSAAAVLLLAMVATLVPRQVHAPFVAVADNDGSTLASDTLAPPSGFTATRTCTGAAPVLRSTSEASGTTTTLAVARPAGLEPGDLLIAVLMQPSAALEPGVTQTDGWSWTARANAGGTFGQGMMVIKVAGSAEPASYTFTNLPSGQGTAVVLLAYDGVDTSAPLASGPHTQQNQSTANVTTAAVSPATAPTTMVSAFVVGSYSSTISNLAPAGTTVRADRLASGTASSRVLVADRSLAATGGSGQTTATLTAVTTSFGFSVALKAAPGPGPVVLGWTPSPDTYLTAYEGRRMDFPDVIQSVGPSVTGYQDGSLGTAGATYELRAAAGGWRSAWVTAVLPAC